MLAAGVAKKQNTELQTLMIQEATSCAEAPGVPGWCCEVFGSANSALRTSPSRDSSAEDTLCAEVPLPFPKDSLPEEIKCSSSVQREVLRAERHTESACMAER